MPGRETHWPLTGCGTWGPGLQANPRLSPHSPRKSAASREALREHLVRFGTGSLTPRTVRRLARPTPSKSEFHFALLEAVEEELEVWGGQTVGGVEGGAKCATLRICATEDRITRRDTLARAEALVDSRPLLADSIPKASRLGWHHSRVILVRRSSHPMC